LPHIIVLADAMGVLITGARPTRNIVPYKFDILLQRLLLAMALDRLAVMAPAGEDGNIMALTSQFQGEIPALALFRSRPGLTGIR
jgi:hypothetical protein